MTRIIGYVPTVLIAILLSPLLVLLSGVRGGDVHLGETTSDILTFVFDDGAFGQLLVYLQAPLMLAVVLNTAVTSPVPNLPIRLPKDVATWVLAAVCVAAVVVAYITRYIFAAQICVASPYCKHLSQFVNIDLKTVPGGVGTVLQNYCGGLIASASAVLTGILFGKTNDGGKPANG